MTRLACSRTRGSTRQLAQPGLNTRSICPLGRARTSTHPLLVGQTKTCQMGMASALALPEGNSSLLGMDGCLEFPTARDRTGWLTQTGSRNQPCNLTSVPQALLMRSSFQQNNQGNPFQRGFQNRDQTC